MEMDKLPTALRVEHDAVLATAPIAYRGYLIKPTSHRFGPFLIDGEFVYWGYLPIYITGEYPGAHAGPGCVWSQNIGGVKTIIDCLHEAGPKPPVTPLPGVAVSRKDALKHTEAQKAWNERFWALMAERRD